MSTPLLAPASTPRPGSPDAPWLSGLLPARAPAALARRAAGFSDAAGETWRMTEPAVCAVPLIVVLEGGFTLHEGEAVRPLLRSFAAGLGDGPSVIGYDRPSACVQIDLHPLAARRLLGPALADLAGGVADLRDLAPALAAELEDRAAEAPDWESRIRLVTETVSRACAAAPPAPPLAARALRAMAAEPADARVGALARRLGVSRQHLSDVLRAQTGLGPKRLARIIRFEAALARLRAPGASLADVAAACGYADQSHMSREIRALGGAPPSAFAA